MAVTDFTDYKVGEWEAPVSALPDRPSISASELKATFDANSIQLRDAYNSLVDALSESGMVDGLMCSDGKTISEALAGLELAILSAITTCKAYTDSAAIEAGAGDMVSAIYDPNRKKQNIYDYADAARSVAENKSLTVAGWTGNGPYLQTVAISQAGTKTNGFVAVAETATATQREAARDAMLSVTERNDNVLTITADGDKPEVEIPIVITMLG